ncbi:MAG: RNA pyrophosphohydrolase [Thiotrichales bacterium]|nr:MAG: RNA pyrophosphohydrolase [Thiotrichales bacterium]
MIDEKGFRLNVAIILCNKENKILLARRLKGNSWQFPQGGVSTGETPTKTMYRELKEEIGLEEADVEIIKISEKWIHYTLPKHLQRKPVDRVQCIGQKQKWFLLRLVGPESHINFHSTNHPEFNAWRWANYWDPIDEVIYFKRNVYRKVLEYFAKYL